MESALQNERPEASLNLSGNRRLPLHLQGEAAECGLACLAMIGGFHGHDIDLISLRRRFCVSSHGTTLKQLMDMASRLQLSGRALRVELEALSQLQLPCILHWDMNHFVVLKQVKGGRAVVYDPARGATTYTLAELGSHFTGVALELLPTQNFAATIDRQRLRISQLWSSITGLKRSLLLILLMALLLQLLAVASPFYLQTVVDDVLLRSDEHLLLVLALG
ncbi:MAG: cysteine peptidase family C39 domain-containing protein, partial [Pseudomonadota bacterium]